MARYTMNYFNDLGVCHQRVGLRVYLVDIDNQEFTTTTEQDFEVLPFTFLSAVLLGEVVCSFPGRTRTIRKAVGQKSGSSLLWIIPCPFRAGSSEFERFFRELEDEFEEVFLEGERIDRAFLLRYADVV